MWCQILQFYYYSRHPKRDEVIALFDRIVKAAEGAALETGTTMNYEMIGGTRTLHVPTFQKMVHKNLEATGAIPIRTRSYHLLKKLLKHSETSKSRLCRRGGSL